MSPKQTTMYWRLWAAVVRAHDLKKLSKAEQDEERRAITLEATGGRTSSITNVRDNKDITRLFRMLEFRANPLGLNEAMRVANPEIEEENDERRRCVFALSRKGLTDKEIQDIATPFCRAHHVSSWKELPSATLKEMMMWKQFQPTQTGTRRRAPVIPLTLLQTGDDTFVYHLKPTPSPKPASVEDPY